MSANKSNKNDSKSDRNLYHPTNIQSSAMTPSIITTINNTNPATPPTIITGNNCNNNNPIYESYIEDSFVGHWEREDDDPVDLYKGNNERDDGERGTDEEDSALHPSTIEFDFDSFGPESFIYSPSAAAATTTTTTTNNLLQSQQEAEQNSIVVNEDNKVENDNIANLVETNEKIKDNNDKHQAEELNAHNLIKSSGRENEIMQGNSENTQVLNSEVKVTSYYLVDNLAQIDMRVIDPYKKVISHAGYCHHLDPSVPGSKPGEPAPAIIVFSACYLPDRSRRDYNYVMDQLFLYVLSSLHELIADDYILVYLHNTQPSATQAAATPSSSTRANSSNITLNGSLSNTNQPQATNQDTQYQNNLPTFTWMKRCYQMIDRKLRKNLKILYLVKPTFWLKTIVIMCKPFISAKFSKKLRFVENMEGLKKCLPVNQLILPASADNI